MSLTLNRDSLKAALAARGMDWHQDPPEPSMLSVPGGHVWEGGVGADAPKFFVQWAYASKAHDYPTLDALADVIVIGCRNLQAQIAHAFALYEDDVDDDAWIVNNPTIPGWYLHQHKIPSTDYWSAHLHLVQLERGVLKVFPDNSVWDGPWRAGQERVLRVIPQSNGKRKKRGP